VTIFLKKMVRYDTEMVEQHWLGIFCEDSKSPVKSLVRIVFAEWKEAWF